MYLNVWYLFAINEKNDIHLTTISELSTLMKKYLRDKSEGKKNDLLYLMLSAHDISMAPFLKIFYPNNQKCIEEEYKKRYIDG